MLEGSRGRRVGGHARGNTYAPVAGRRRPAGVTISHSHARLLAYFWEEPDRPDFAVTVLARTGAIRRDTEDQLVRDLAALETAAEQSSDPGETISERQVSALLDYVRRHGIRGEVVGWWDQADDGEFGTHTVAFARARRAEIGEAPRTGRRPSTRTPHAPEPAHGRPSGHASPSIYEQLGGAAAIRAAVDLFYRKVLDDQRLAPYFRDTNIARLKAHQRAMLTAVTGGEQDEYADMDGAMDRLRVAHERLRITRGDFNAVATHLVTTLIELGVDPPLVEQLTPTILGLRETIVTVADVRPLQRKEQEKIMALGDGAPQTTVYDRIGGADAIRAAVDLFYRKVLADERVNHHFEGVNLARLKAHQRAMITAVAGGPNTYSGASMRDAHNHLEITNGEFDVVVGHLVGTLQELGVPQEEIDRLAPPILELRDDITA
jgi:hemoglobin